MIRRFLIFVALFGGGLLLLLQLDRGSSLRFEQRSLSDEDDPTRGLRLRPSGPFYYVKFHDLSGGERVRRFLIDAIDSNATDDGGVLLEDARMEFFGEGGLDRQSLVRADTARLKITMGGGTTQPRLSDVIELWGARLSLEGSNRLLPVNLTTEYLSGNLETRRFETEERVFVTGSNLTSSGRGMVVDRAAGEMRFLSENELIVKGDDGETATLRCDGPLEFVRNIDEPDDPLRVFATRNAVLTLSGEDDAVLRANRIEIVARGSGEDADVLLFEKLEAIGEVDLVSKGNNFRAERALFTFDDESRLSSTTLAGSPNGSLLVSAIREELAEELEPIHIKVWGRGPMTLNWQPNRRFQVAGPARLQWAGTELWADGGISGNSTAKQEELEFRAWGEVEVDRDGWRVKTPELRGVGSETWVDLFARGPARLNGATDDGSRLALLAREGFDFRVEKRGWSMPSARGVDLDWIGERSFSARAQSVVNMVADLERNVLSLAAHDAVEVRSNDNFLRGSHLVVTSPDEAELLGSGDRNPASFVSPWGEVRAGSIRRERDEVIANGDVFATFDVAPFAGDVRATDLTLSGFHEELALEGPFDVRLFAEGDVHANLTGSDGEYTIDSTTLWVRRKVVEDVTIEPNRTEVHAKGLVRALVSRPEGRLRLRADEVLADTTDEGQDADKKPIAPLGQLVATGNVEVVRLDEGDLVATGDRLIVDHTGRGRLEPPPGGWVLARGTIPDGDQRFQLESRSLEFHGEEIDAAYPRLELHDPSPSAEFEEVASGIAATVHANANRLLLGPESIELIGNGRFRGQMVRGETWELFSDRTVLVPQRDRDPDAAPFERLLAEGNVLLVFSRGQRAVAERLIVEGWSRRLRFEGSPSQPARFFDSRMVYESSEIELDTHNMLVNTGPNRLRAWTPDDDWLGSDPW
ncbi:MAG: hypothetical protein GC161_03940 [Planctomycetaceae bacterium]|nr:hypothetical protein [Planctomycetaceae bacterium]